MEGNDLSPDSTLTLLGATLKTTGQLEGDMLQYLEGLLREVGMNPNDKRDVAAFIKAIQEELTRLPVGKRLNINNVIRLATYYRGKERTPKSALDMIKDGYRQK